MHRECSLIKLFACFMDVCDAAGIDSVFGCIVQESSDGERVLGLCGNRQSAVLLRPAFFCRASLICCRMG